MSEQVYTHAVWRVRPGCGAEFIEAWGALSDCFSSLPAQPLWGTLIRSVTDPTLFVSFGPWPSAESVQAMRADPLSQVALDRLRRLCVEATPGSFEIVRHIQVRDTRDER